MDVILVELFCFMPSEPLIQYLQGKQNQTIQEADGAVRPVLFGLLEQHCDLLYSSILMQLGKEISENFFSAF